MSFFLWNILLAVNWALLTGHFNLENLVAGFVIGFFLLWILRRGVGETSIAFLHPRDTKVLLEVVEPKK